MSRIGQFMAIRVYNTLSGQKEPFEPVKAGKVGMYLCGPTVYKSPHIGHMVGPIIFDAIKRYLTFRGYKVTWVVNITDIDDKLIKAAQRLNSTVAELAQKYTAEYLELLKLLDIHVDVMPRATDHIRHIIEMCEKLIEKGHAYAAEGSVYFSVTSDPDYLKLTRQKLENLGSGEEDARGKRNPRDFALWKSAKPGEPMWDSPWGKGRPGWHIECSAMSHAALGETIDIHGGGMDLKFPHHENELAQSESATGRTFVKYWLHNGLTRVKTKNARGEESFEDIHETTGNAGSVRARALVDRLGSEVFRYILLSTHYRSPIDFSEDVVVASKKGYSAFERVFERLDRAMKSTTLTISDAMVREELPDELKRFEERFIEVMDDDFNTAGAIGVLHELASHINRVLSVDDADVAHAMLATNLLKKLGGLLGLFNSNAHKAVGESRDSLVDDLMKLMIELRAQVRSRKDFATADAIRDGLAKLGITIEDRADGSTWKKS